VSGRRRSPAGGEVLVGIDLGTTMLKVAAFDARTGERLASGSARLAVRTSAAGAREQDVSAIDDGLARLARSLRRRLGRAWRRVGGVGLAAQGGSAILVDRATGRARTRMQLWSDTRPLARLDEIAARRPRGYWQRLAYMHGPGSGLARIEWLRRRHPKLFDGRTLYVGAGEYLYFRLTGVWRQDPGSALQVGCYDARRRRLAPGALRTVGVGPELVAPIRVGHQTHPLGPAAAAALDLPEGIPVAGPYFDHEAGYLASAGVSSRPLHCSLGTAWVGSYVVESGPPPASGLNLVVPSPVGPGSLVVRVMLAGNASWDWALATLAGAGAARTPARAEAVFRERLLPADGLTALPWLTRPNPLAPDTHGGGGFVGVSVHTTRDDLLRAMVAGMCYEFARLFEPVTAAGTVDAVALGGGASNGWQFRTLLAGLLAPLPVTHLDDDCAGARGTLVAFSPTVARLRGRRVRRPGGSLQRRIRDGYARYLHTCRLLSRGLGGDGGVFLDMDRKG